MDLMTDPGPALLETLQRHLPSEHAWKLLEGRTLRWWPCEMEQTIIADEPTIEVDLSLVRLTITTRVLEGIGESDFLFTMLGMLNRLPCGSAWIWDESDGSVVLHTTHYIHPENATWVTPMVQFTCVTQMARAQALIGPLTKSFVEGRRRGKLVTSPHPIAGVRNLSDDLQAFLKILIPEMDSNGRNYGLDDFKESEAGFGPDPSVMTNFDRTGLTAEFPFHGRTPATVGFFDRWMGRQPKPLGTARLIADSKTPNPEYGLGCLMLLTLPVAEVDPRLVNLLNLHERNDRTGLQGTGAWSIGQDGITHASFLPAGLNRRGLFGLMYRNAALRAAWAGRFLA